MRSIEFHDVRIPRENILLAEGKGLRVALSTLNTGRLTLPAACVGLAKRCLEISTRWAKEASAMGQADRRACRHREQTCRHGRGDICHGIDDFAHCRRWWIERNPTSGLNPPSARCSQANGLGKSPMTQCRFAVGVAMRPPVRWLNVANHPDPVERIVRDSRINTIFEGSSEIMRLFIAREAVDPALQDQRTHARSPIVPAAAQCCRPACREVLRTVVRFHVSSKSQRSEHSIADLRDMFAGARRHLVNSREDCSIRWSLTVPVWKSANFCWLVLWMSARSCSRCRRRSRAFRR